jgi:lysozyme family protein
VVYTDIQTLRGLDKPVDYGSGIEYAEGILDSLFPDQYVGLQDWSLAWHNGTAGSDDIKLRRA